MKRWIDFSFGRKGYGKVGKRKAAFQLSHSHDYYEIPSVMGYGFKGQVHRGLQARRKGTSSFSAWSPNRRPESKTHDLEETTLPLLLKSASGPRFSRRGDAQQPERFPHRAGGCVRKFPRTSGEPPR